MHDYPCDHAAKYPELSFIGPQSFYTAKARGQYSEKDLMVRQAEQIEQTLWIALRIMEERKSLFLKLLSESKNKNNKTMVSFYEKKAHELEQHIERMKKVIFDLQNS